MDIWQLRIDKHNQLISAYEALYASRENDMAELTEGTTPYNEAVIQQIQLADEIEAKKLAIARMLQDKAEQEAMRERKAVFANEQGETVIKTLREKLSPVLRDDNKRAAYQSLLAMVNKTEKGTPEYVEAIFDVATKLGML
jgi:hypothetical protein